MADFTRREVVTRTVEYAIPSGTAATELHKALAVAESDYRRLHTWASNDPLFDDWARVYARDDEVVIEFEVKA